MIKLNDNFEHLPQRYIFTEVGMEVAKFKKENPDVEIIRMDVGDVSQPLCEAAVKAMHEAVDDLTRPDTLAGYGPEEGYKWLRETIARKVYSPLGVDFRADEIFISDGAAADLGNLGNLFAKKCTVAAQDPVYPVYVDASIIDGRNKIILLPCTAQNNFVPELPKERADIIYLCFPNNPTASVLTADQLKIWIDYARDNGSIIIYDGAYEAYIRTSGVPRSIYEVEGAREVAIEVRSFSKVAGFTGVRCGYTVVPSDLRGFYSDGERADIRAMWDRRQHTKFNGASYISQRGALASLSEEGIVQTRAQVDYYLRNAGNLRAALESVGIEAFGGVDSPYVWVKTPGNMTSWDCFHMLLDKARVTCTPGSGFGKAGEGYVRLTGFNTKELTAQAAERLRKLL